MPNTAPLLPSALLERIASELLACRTILSRIEHSVHEILDRGPPGAVSRSWQKNMQDIDLLEQNLGDLARCLQATASEGAVSRADAVSEDSVLGPLRLDDLRQRLRGRHDLVESPSDVEFF